MTTTDEDTLAKLLGHPRRRKIMRSLFEAAAPRSPVELAVDLDEGLPDVVYHVRRLSDADALRLVDAAEERRGSVGQFYVAGPLIERNRDFVAVVLAAD